MQHRILGTAGLDISEVGLGCWQIGGNWGGTIEEDKAIEILQTAVDQDITFFDTADVYGDGRSERLIGEFLKGSSKDIKVATKFGRQSHIFPNNYTQDVLRKCVEASCERIGMSQLDLLQLHCIPTEELRKGDIFDWLRQLKEEGLIKYFGASVESVEEGLICIEQEGLQSLQVIYNIFRQKLTTELLPQAAKKGVGIIVRLPLASGLLSGKFTKDTQFDTEDHRNFNKDGQIFNVGETFAGLPYEKGVELSDQLKTKTPEGMTLLQMSLRWILDHPEVTTIIPGASKVEHVISNAQASNLPPLSPDLIVHLANFYHQEIHDHVRGVY